MNEGDFKFILEKTRVELHHLIESGCDDFLKRKIQKTLALLDDVFEKKDDEPQWLVDAAHDVGLVLKKKKRIPKIYD